LAGLSGLACVNEKIIQVSCEKEEEEEEEEEEKEEETKERERERERESVKCLRGYYQITPNKGTKASSANPPIFISARIELRGA
jgi:hypothetical protein